jgi:hypothetical protein
MADKINDATEISEWNLGKDVPPCPRDVLES